MSLSNSSTSPCQSIMEHASTERWSSLSPVAATKLHRFLLQRKTAKEFMSFFLDQHTCNSKEQLRHTLKDLETAVGNMHIRADNVTARATSDTCICPLLTLQHLKESPEPTLRRRRSVLLRTIADSRCMVGLRCRTCSTRFHPCHHKDFRRSLSCLAIPTPRMIPYLHPSNARNYCCYI